jgi:hypothetical protein
MRTVGSKRRLEISAWLWPRVCALVIGLGLNWPALLIGGAAMLAPALPPPAWGQGVPAPQVFNCIGAAPQTVVVPQGVTVMGIAAAGAHGSYPDLGTAGAAPGDVQATFAVAPNTSVAPGNTLYVWVACIAQDNLAWGWANGGASGSGSGAGGDGGFGGGATAVTLDAAGLQTLVVAGGGGGGGGGGIEGELGTPGGQGGWGGNPPANGSSGFDGGAGGLVNNSAGGFAGGWGTDAGAFSASGGGGGGGGGIDGGGGGHGANTAGGGGGGAGGGSAVSYLVKNVTYGVSGTSGDGYVVISWSASPLPDADHDGIPDVADQCGSSDQRPTVVIKGCDSGVQNRLDAYGCTFEDRILKIDAEAKNHGQLVEGVDDLIDHLRMHGLLTKSEKKALHSCAAKAR